MNEMPMVPRPLVRSTANRLFRIAGVPTPHPLVRAPHPYAEHALAGIRVRLHAATTPAADTLRRTLERGGATLVADAAEPTHAVIFDATGLASAADARALYDCFHTCLPTLPANSRVLLVARGVEGFARSLAKELGRRGAIANLLYVEPSAPLHFLLSPRAKFVSGQPLRVSTTVTAPQWPTTQVEPLAGKITLVTSAAQGLGAAIALRLTEEGAKPVCLDIDASAEAPQQVAARAGGALTLTMDVTAADAPQRLVEALRAHGGIDIVVHNASVIRDRTLAKMEASCWDTVVTVNLDAILRIDDSLLVADLLRDEGHVRCLSSIAGVASNVGQTNYGFSKAAEIRYATVQSRRLAARGITVNAIAPGMIETPMMRLMPCLFREIGCRLNALAQAGVPQDVAEAVTFFLCKPFAYGVTGQTLRVCCPNLLGA
ncbi:TPA: SDR family oxidoreductase [Pseudomonas aeruginosa]